MDGRQNNASLPLKDGHVLISRTCEYVSLHGKSVSAGVIKLRILRLEYYPGLFPGGPPCNHKCPYKKEAKESKSQKGKERVINFKYCLLIFLLNEMQKS